MPANLNFDSSARAGNHPWRHYLGGAVAVLALSGCSLLDSPAHEPAPARIVQASTTSTTEAPTTVLRPELASSTLNQRVQSMAQYYAEWVISDYLDTRSRHDTTKVLSDDRRFATLTSIHRATSALPAPINAGQYRFAATVENSTKGDYKTSSVTHILLQESALATRSDSTEDRPDGFGSHDIYSLEFVKNSDGTWIINQSQWDDVTQPNNQAYRFDTRFQAGHDTIQPLGGDTLGALLNQAQFILDKGVRNQPIDYAPTATR